MMCTKISTTLQLLSKIPPSPFTNSTYKYLGKQIGLNLNLKNNFALSPYIGERIQRVRRYHEADPETCQWFKNLLPILSRRQWWSGHPTTRVFDPNLTIFGSTETKFSRSGRRYDSTQTRLCHSQTTASLHDCDKF